MHRASLLLVLLLALPGCGGEERAEPAPPPAVQQRTKPVWCPKERFERVRREDGRYDVRRIPHGTFDARELLGKRLDAAERLAERNDCSIRILIRDGERLTGSTNGRLNRVNVSVRRGYVTALLRVG